MKNPIASLGLGGLLLTLLSLSPGASGSSASSDGDGAQPHSGGEVNIAIQPEPPSLMLPLVQNNPVQLIGGNIFESLLRYSTDLEPMPQLAKSWEIGDDGLTYTFHLYDNVVWHDGEPFSAEDVVFSVGFMTEVEPQARETMSHVERIETPDANTVVFHLKQPYPAFIMAFEVGSMPMVPKHIYEGTDYHNNPANAHPIGTGPFEFERWDRGSVIVLSKNEDYYQEGLPYLDTLYWHVIPDAASRAAAYENGTLDVLPAGSVENFDLERLADLPGSCITNQGSEMFNPFAMLWLNNREGPMSDVRFRKAVMYALDRQFANDVLWNGLGRIPAGPFSSKLPEHDDSIEAYPHDPEQARALLDEMGYNGEQIRLLPLPYGETWARWSEAVRQNLEDAGINVTTEATDVAGWNQAISQWDYDIAFTYLYQYSDPSIGISRTYNSDNIARGSPWNNVEGYRNERVDELFAAAAVEADPEARQQLYSEVQQILHEEVPLAWLLEMPQPVIHGCDVHNLITTGIGISDGFKNAWIESGD
ncbi:ABC transporter substrate-binding protein [Kushneria aurantia]|uniref:ABC transporter substrate-binding protein n=1 Tax=Kushneria aurantia TaxID=504092 RepID=A0ABV6FZX3_9GAMM|nr:ABC transporter substrate-binding protein [Kushneria aurantia]